MAAGRQRWSTQILAGSERSPGVLLLRYRRHSGGDDQVGATLGASKATKAATGATSAAVKWRRQLERGQMTRPQSTAFEMSNVMGIAELNQAETPNTNGHLRFPLQKNKELMNDIFTNCKLKNGM